MLWKLAVFVPLALLAGGVLTLALFSLLSRKPANLGPHEGRLSACPASPNCVCSQGGEDAGHAVEPLRFQNSPEEAWARLQTVLRSWPRTQIVQVNETYLHAECTSLVFRFVDDVEFLLDREARLIHVRSASRAGRSDLGVNRQRVEAIRAAFAQ